MDPKELTPDEQARRLIEVERALAALDAPPRPDRPRPAPMETPAPLDLETAPLRRLLAGYRDLFAAATFDPKTMTYLLRLEEAGMHGLAREDWWIAAARQIVKDTQDPQEGA